MKRPGPSVSESERVETQYVHLMLTPLGMEITSMARAETLT